MPSYAYFNKQFVPLSEAKLGIMTHCLHYGTALFEGIRGNWNSEEKQLYLLLKLLLNVVQMLNYGMDQVENQFLIISMLINLKQIEIFLIY